MVFEPKYHLSDLCKTDAIPPSQIGNVNIEGLKTYFKDSPLCLD